MHLLPREAGALHLGCIVELPRDILETRVLGPYPRNPDLIGLRCGLDLGFVKGPQVSLARQGWGPLPYTTSND